MFAHPIAKVRKWCKAELQTDTLPIRILCLIVSFRARGGAAAQLLELVSE